MDDLLRNEIVRIELAPENTSKERLLEIIKELYDEIENIDFDSNDYERQIDSLFKENKNLKDEIEGLRNPN